MMRTALARRTPLRSKSALRRSGRVSPVNRERKTKRYARDFGDEADLVRALPCLITGTTPSEPAHVTSRGAGGGRFDLVPLSPEMHRQQHEVGILSFQACHNLDLREIADRIALEHPEPLGIRGLAKAFDSDGVLVGRPCPACLGGLLAYAGLWRAWAQCKDPKCGYRYPSGDATPDRDRADLLGWVRRRLALLGEENRRAAGEYYGAFPLGESFREDAAEAIADALNLDDVSSATALCEASGWPS